MQGESRPHYVRCHVPITSRHNPRHVLVTYAVTSPSLPRRVRCHVPSCPHHVPLLSVTSAVTSRWTCRAAVTSTSHSPSHPHHVPSHPCHVPVTSPSRPRLMFPVTSLRSRITSPSRPVTSPLRSRHIPVTFPVMFPVTSPVTSRYAPVAYHVPVTSLSRPRYAPVTSPSRFPSRPPFLRAGGRLRDVRERERQALCLAASLPPTVGPVPLSSVPAVTSPSRPRHVPHHVAPVGPVPCPPG